MGRDSRLYIPYDQMSITNYQFSSCNCGRVLSRPLFLAIKMISYQIIGNLHTYYRKMREIDHKG